jgi:hypothetical protein
VCPKKYSQRSRAASGKASWRDVTNHLRFYFSVSNRK